MSDSFSIIPKETALLVIDMQNSYCHPQGSIGRNGYDYTMMNATIPKVKELVEACRQAGILDIWTIQNHYPDDITRKTHRIKPHTHRWQAGPPALKGTWDAEIVDELKDLAKEPAELVIKHRFSAFFDTTLDTLLRMKGITTLVVSGVATTHCVETSVRDAYQRDYDVIVAEDAVAGLTLESHQSSLKLINKTFGLTLPNEEIIKLANGETIPIEIRTESLIK